MRIPWRMVQDDDSHWYLIPKPVYDKFLDWVEWTCSEHEMEYSGPDFELFRINSPQDIDILTWETSDGH